MGEEAYRKAEAAIERLLDPTVPAEMVTHTAGLIVVFENRFEAFDARHGPAAAFPAAPDPAPITEHVVAEFLALHPGARVVDAGPDPEAIAASAADADLLVAACDSLPAFLAASAASDSCLVVAARVGVPGASCLGLAWGPGLLSSIVRGVDPSSIPVQPEDVEWARFDIDRRDLAASVEEVAAYRRVALEATDGLRGLIYAVDMPASPMFHLPRVWVNEIAVVTEELRWDLAAGDSDALSPAVRASGTGTGLASETVRFLEQVQVVDREVAALFHLAVARSLAPDEDDALGDAARDKALEGVRRDAAGMVAVPDALLGQPRGLVPLWELLQPGLNAKPKLARTMLRQFEAAGRAVTVVPDDEAAVATAAMVEAAGMAASDVVLVRRPYGPEALWAALRLASTRLVLLSDITDGETSDVATGLRGLGVLLMQGADAAWFTDQDRRWASNALQQRDDSSWTLDAVVELGFMFRTLRETVVGGVFEVALRAVPSWPTPLVRAREVVSVDELSFVGVDIDNLGWVQATLDRNGLPDVSWSVRHLVERGAISLDEAGRFMARLVMVPFDDD